MKIWSSQRGFTIVELLTVVLVASVLLAIAAPSFRGMLDRRRIEGRANEFLTDLQYARSEAVARNRNVVLIPGGGGTCYTLAAWREPAVRTGSCDCTVIPPAPVCTVSSPVNPTDPVELKTVTLTNAVTVATTGTFDFEPVRGAQQSAAAASAAVAHSVRTYTVRVESNGRVAPLTY